MKKRKKAPETAPVTVRMPVETIKSIDDWRRAHRSIPSRGEFLRQAVEEKLSGGSPNGSALRGQADGR